MIESGALVDLKVQSDKLLFNNVERLLSAEISDRTPAQSHPFGEDVLGCLHVFGSRDLKNWMVGVDEPTLFFNKIMQVYCIKIIKILMQIICNSANNAREAETCFH